MDIILFEVFLKSIELIPATTEELNAVKLQEVIFKLTETAQLPDSELLWTIVCTTVSYLPLKLNESSY